MLISHYPNIEIKGNNMEELAYKIKADFLKTLGHPVRLQIVELLKSGEKNVGAIVKTLGIPQSSLSRHLLVLREGDILKSRQQGTVIYYNIEDHDIFQVLRLIAEMLYKKLKRTEVVLSSLGKGK
jgi:ArsR family transcriptional regulator